MLAAEISLRILLTVIKCCLSTDLFRRYQQLAQTNVHRVSMTTYIQRLQYSVSNVNTVSAILYVQLSTAMS